MPVCRSCGEDNPDKAKFCLNCGQSMAFACPNCGEENPEKAKFCLNCGQPLAAPGEAAAEEEEGPREVRKVVSIVFTDLAGSTAMQEKLDPESTRRVMLRYRDEMRAAIERHGGVLEKFIGDAIMAVWGVPIVNEDDALRAVRAAIDMREALGPLNQALERNWGVTLKVRTGVNTGEVLAGEAWDEETGVLGDTVNTAARFEQAAPAGEILCGASTYSLVKNVVEAEPMEPLTLKGKSEPVPVYRIVGLKTGEEPARRLDTPMVGRDVEMAKLREHFDRAVEERLCHMFTVLGPAGAGKSRLAAELLQHAPDNTVAFKGRCLPYGEGITFWPIVEIVKEAAGILDDDSPESARSKIADLLKDAEDAELVGSIVSQVVGLLDPVATREEIFWAVRKFLERIASRGPVVVILDDIHWAEQTLLDLIVHVATWAKTSPLLLLCMARPDLLDRHPEWGEDAPNTGHILLEPLNEEAVVSLLEHLLGEATLSEDIRAKILEASGGNPFFVEEMVSMLIEQGMLERQNGAWVPTGDISSISVPPTIQALLGARLDRLEKEERKVVERGSVVGKVFTTRGITAISPASAKPNISGHLTTLEKKEFIRRDLTNPLGDEAYTFRHILIRDAAYNALPKEARAELHEAFADWLTDYLGDRATEQEEILGYHLEQAYKLRSELGMILDEHQQLAIRAAERLTSAGRRATGRGDEHAAVNLLTRSVNLLDEDDPRRTALLPELGIALMDSGDFDEAEKIFEQAMERASASGNRGVEAHARIQAWLLKQQTELEPSSEAAIEEAQRSIKIFEELGDDIGLSNAWHLQAYSHTVLGQSYEAEQALEKSIAHAKRSRNHYAEAASRRALIITMLFGPTTAEDTVRRVEDHLSWARATGDLITEARALGALGQARAMLGEFEDARELIAREKRIFEELGSKLRVAWTAFEASAVELLAGDAAAAETELLTAYDFLEQMGEKATLPTLAAILAEAKYIQEDFDEAERLCLVSKESSADDDFLSLMAWRSTYAKVKARRGEFEEAEKLSREAIDIASRTDFLDAHGGVMMDLAEVMRLAGRHDRAADAAGEGLRLYEKKGNRVAAERAQQLLTELAALTT